MADCTRQRLRAVGLVLAYGLLTLTFWNMLLANLAARQNHERHAHNQQRLMGIAKDTTRRVVDEDVERFELYCGSVEWQELDVSVEKGGNKLLFFKRNLPSYVLHNVCA